MRRMLALSAALLLGAGLAQPLAAQAAESALTRQMIQTQRQAIVAANLPMTDSVAQRFWPMYRDYRTAMASIGDRTEQLLRDYAANYQAMTEASAQKLLDDWMAIRKDDLKLRQDWVKKFRKVFPATLVGRFFQIENKLDAIIAAELADAIPLLPAK